MEVNKSQDSDEVVHKWWSTMAQFDHQKFNNSYTEF
jgi:hypothetical protein